MPPQRKHRSTRLMVPALAIFMLAAASPARADIVVTWSARAAEWIAASKLPAPAMYRLEAMVQTAVYDAVRATASLRAPEALDAAVAAATCAVVRDAIPALSAAATHALDSALAALPATPAREAGRMAGESAAAAVLLDRSTDGALATEAYVFATQPGKWVPTARPVGPQWGARRGWWLGRSESFRPGPPPSLASAAWARDLAESRALGASQSGERRAEQTAVALFWEATAPPIYLSLAHGLALTPGRDVLRNARLLALLTQAMDDALIAVFDAKYHYSAWRPITAIRAAATDGNEATTPDPAWTPLIETPMHPEYPCAHCALAGAVTSVLRAETGDKPSSFSTNSPTRPGQQRVWTRLEDFEAEVSNARIWAGVHFRNSADVGTRLGERVGSHAVQHFDHSATAGWRNPR